MTVRRTSLADRPPDTATTTWDAVYESDGVYLVQSWVERPCTEEELAARQAEANRVAVTATDALRARLERLVAYRDDADVVAALGRANTTAPTPQELNRLLKVVLRRQQRQDAAIALLLRLLDAELLVDVGDAAES